MHYRPGVAELAAQGGWFEVRLTERDPLPLFLERVPQERIIRRPKPHRVLAAAYVIAAGGVGVLDPGTYVLTAEPPLLGDHPGVEFTAIRRRLPTVVDVRGGDDEFDSLGHVLL